MTAEALARDIVAGAADKKATDLVVLAMGGAVSYTDFFVLATGGNPRQTRAIAEEIQHKVRPRRAARVEGEREGEWILLDYIDVVVHVFTPAARDFYRLETLWGDVPRLELALELEA
jgi:ribosome-associated protein